MSKPIISVENLSKAYRLGRKEEAPDTLVSAVAGALKAPLRNWRNLRRLDTSRRDGDEGDDILWALRDVSFDVQRGEVVGIIGRNGAGKSTLLKILSRITEPTSGRIVLRGRVSSLLEVGTGFHPELTGRDNIYMNGTILGMRKREIDRKFDEIVEFSGVEKFLDTPVKRYSSGMTVRLAFAVAAHLEPEILIVDEVLAVGDAEFQKKCLGKMQDVAQGGRTVLFVSHNMAAVEALCARGVCLYDGKLKNDGEIGHVINTYRQTLELAAKNENSFYVAKGDGIIRAVHLINEDERPTSFVEIGKPLRLRLELNAATRLVDPRVRITFENNLGIRLLMIQPPQRLALGPMRGELTLGCTIPEFPLAPGRYKINLSIADGRESLETINAACSFVCEDAELFDEGRGFTQGVCASRSLWTAGVTASL